MKKFIALILSGAMAMSSAVLTAGAAEIDYERVIPEVKNRIELPWDCTEFSYNGISAYDGEDRYEFSWKSTEADRTVYVTCDDDGNVYEYYSGLSYDAKAIATLDREKARETALSFIEKANSKLKDCIKLEPYTMGYEMSFRIIYTLYGIDYKAELGSISITTDYAIDSMHIGKIPKIEKFENLISADEGYKLYMDKIGVKTEYHIEDDLGIPYYRDFSDKAIDAQTGEVINIKNNYILYANESAAGAMAADKGEAYRELSESEIEGTDAVKSLIGKDRIISAAENAVGKKVEENGVSIYKSNDRYFYNLSFENGGFANMDAQSGDFSYISIMMRKGEKLDLLNGLDLKDKDKSFELLKKLSPGYAKNYSFGEYADKSIRFVYKVNGIDVADAAAEIQCEDEDEYTYFYYYASDVNAYKDKEYTAPSEFIPQENLFGNVSFVKLMYIDTEDGIRPAYLPESFMINAKTGENKYQNRVYSYTDIDNHWIKNTAEKLSYMGIGFDGEKLEPDKAVTRYEACIILNNVLYRIDVYKIDADKNDTSEITRAETADIIVDAMDLHDLSKSDIFKPVFSDMTENYGAAAILRGMGIISESDRFRPNDKLTRAELLQLAYNAFMKVR